MKKYYEYNRKWRKENPDKVRKHRKQWKVKNPKKVKEALKRYRLKHPEKLNNNRPWKRYPMEEIAKRDGRKCKKCGAIKDLTINHKIPRIVYDDERKVWDVPLKQLEILCRKCNNKHYQQIVKKALRFYFSRKLTTNKKRSKKL